MIRKLILTLTTLMALSSHGQSSSNDIGRSDSTPEILSAKDIREMFEIQGSIFVTDGQGKLLFQGVESRTWQFGSVGNISSNWSYSSEATKEIALRHVWSLSEDGKITVHVQQFDWMKRGEKNEIKTGKLVREEKFDLKDFSAVNWVVSQDTSRRVIVRLVPLLNEKPKFIEINELPLSLSSAVVFDNKGNLWDQVEHLEARFIGFKTHRGMIAMSFHPFKGAKEIGFAKGNEIHLSYPNGLKIKIIGKKTILPTGQPAKIYGIIDLTKKSERLNSIYAYSSNTEKEFLTNLK